MSLRASVTESSLSESFGDNDLLNLGKLYADLNVLSPREECWVLYPDLIEQPDEWSKASYYFPV
jgi:hypothetical protein